MAASRNREKQLNAGIMLANVSTVLRVLIQILYTSFLLRVLGQSEYGLYTLVSSVVGYLSLLNLGFGSAYVRFYAIAKKEGKSTAVLNSTFLKVYLFMSIVALIIGLAFANYPNLLYGDKLDIIQLESASIITKILVINISLSFPASLFEAIVISNERFIFNRLLRLLTILFDPFLGALLLLAGHDVFYLAIATLIINMIKLILDILYCKKKLNVSFDFKAFDVDLLKNVSNFSFFVFLTIIIEHINWSVDKYILGRMIGTTAVAVYSIGALVNSMFVSFSSTIHSVFIPRINVIAASNSNCRSKQLTDFFVNIGRIQFQVLMLLATAFVFFGRFFITNIYASKEYSDAYYVALLLFIPNIIPLTQNTGIEIQRALNKHRVLSIVYLLMSIVNILISIPLARALGPIGSALGTSISVLIGNVLIANFYYYKVLKIDVVLYWKNVFSMLKGMIIPFFAGFIILKIGYKSIRCFILCAFMYFIVYCASIWLFSMNNAEKSYIRQKWM